MDSRRGDSGADTIILSPKEPIFASYRHQVRGFTPPPNPLSRGNNPNFMLTPFPYEVGEGLGMGALLGFT